MIGLVEPEKLKPGDYGGTGNICSSQCLMIVQCMYSVLVCTLLLLGSE